MMIQNIISKPGKLFFQGLEKNGLKFPRLGRCLGAAFFLSLTAEARPPNMVVFLADDMGYADLGSYGGKTATPNIDKLAEQGVRLTDAYVNCPACTGSRAGFMTGAYHIRSGTPSVYNPDLQKNKHRGMNLDEVTLAEVLKTKEYATAYIGKWHLGDHPKYHPTAQGFDTYFGLPYSHDMRPGHPTFTNFPPLRLIENDQIIDADVDEKEQRQLLSMFTEKSLRFIEQNQAKPFLLYLAYQSPHVPLFPSQAFEGKSGQGLYGDVLKELDASVGTVLNKLEELGLDRNTLVVFSSDNGPWLLYGTHGGSAGELREGKGNCFEGGIRVPMILKWPGRIPPGSVRHEPVINLDLLPTVADIVGYDLKQIPHKIDGTSILPLLKGEPQAELNARPLAFYYRGQLRGLRKGKWKLILEQTYYSMENPPKLPSNDGLPGEYNMTDTPDLLFDLAVDPGERRDVLARHPEVAEELFEMVESWRKTLGDRATGQRGSEIRSGGVFHD